MNKTMPVVAIVGRTNVGKSTLFNRLSGRKLAIVEDVPGVTRDRSYATVTRHGFPFSLVDTGGLVGEEGNIFQLSVREQSELAISEAEVVVVLFDGTTGPQPGDYEVVDLLRRSEKQVVWVINKCEKESAEEAAVEFYSLGIEDFTCISAAHNKNIDLLVEKIRETLGAEKRRVDPDEEDAIRVGLVGKPNVGKSTLMNRLLGEERVIASEVAGTTRDSIDIRLTREGQDYILIDTAGLRKKSKIKQGTVERFSNLRTLSAIASADVVVLLIDATEGVPTEQDVKIAGLAHDRGIPLLIAVNKWDAVEKDHTSAKTYKTEVYRTMKFARYAPIIFISAETGKRCPSIFANVKEVYESARKRIATGELNRFLKRTFEAKPPPVYRGQPIKLFFATQVGVAPPAFLLFLSHPIKLPVSYLRYVSNSLRKRYGFEGTNIKITCRKRAEKQERLLSAGNE